MKRILSLLLLIAAGTAVAASNTAERLGELESELDGVRQEQQSVYQSYQMTKELRRAEVKEDSPFMMQYPHGTGVDAQWPNYDDVIREQQEREKRIEQYTSELKGLSARYLELESQRKALLKQIMDLRQHPDD